MKLFNLVILLSLTGLSHARLGEQGGNSQNETTTLHDNFEVQDANFDATAVKEEEEEQQRELQVVRTFSNPNAAALMAEAGFCRVMVGFKNNRGRGAVRQASARWSREMRNVNAATMLIPCSAMDALRGNRNIDYVEEDGLVAPDAERIPPGISVAQGRSSVIPTPPSSSTGACNDPNSFKVAIIDSGLDASHPDIPCRDINAVDTNCKGTSIGINGQAWYEPSSRAWHGTHVFGTIGAIGGNNQGVTSMLPTSNGICYLIARVFDDDNNGQFASVIFEGIDWAISEGANVINMSLSGPTTYTTGQRTFDAAYAKGALAVAAAGNGDSTAFRYPASYDKVLAVAAVDSNGNRAYFSQYNSKVDIAGPGVSVLSTIVGGGYSTSTGTSMAAPHVTGAIAKAWSVCTQCSNDQVQQCLLQTATNSRRTDETGFGNVRAEATYNCLVDAVQCCNDDAAPPQEDFPDEPDENIGLPDEPQSNTIVIVTRPTSSPPGPAPTRARTPAPVPSPPRPTPAPKPLAPSPARPASSPQPTPAPEQAPTCFRRTFGMSCFRDSQCCSLSCGNGICQL